MRSARDVILLGMWVPDSVSPSSAPPTSTPAFAPSAGPEGPRTSDLGSQTGSDWGGGGKYFWATRCSSPSPPPRPVPGWGVHGGHREAVG